jgi:xylulokinase
MLLLGYDIGSSSVKASLLDAATGSLVASGSSPKTELPIVTRRPGWAEQHPDVWWEHVGRATAELRGQVGQRLTDVRAVGLSYQMHGLVVVDENLEPLRPAIIWCDSRAVELGERAFAAIGRDLCLTHLCNSPGNFTASKLAWVKTHEPEIYRQIHKFLLPGDFIAAKLTGEVCTTVSGLSEGILWDFAEGRVADLVLTHYGIAPDLVPRRVDTFAVQGALTRSAAAALGLPVGIPLAYRAGDQPNNALSLNVLRPGEMATTAGTSGVVYGVSARAVSDPHGRVNTFVHVNHVPERPRHGVLLCVNGTGILNSWLKRELWPDGAAAYDTINAVAATAPPGAAGLSVLPFGNGAERTLANRNLGASLHGLDLNRHTRAHVARAVQEGIVFALNHGIGALRELGLDLATIRAGHANLFLSPLFGEAFATVTGARVELYRTDGSQGAARGAGLGAGIYANPEDAFEGLKAVRTIEPDAALVPVYQAAYRRWGEILETEMKRCPKP